MADKMLQNWTPEQIKYMQFVSRGKTNKKGEKRTDEQFAEAIGVTRMTLWRWAQLPGFNQAVLDLIIKEQLLPDLPIMIQGQRQLAKGVDTIALDARGNKKKLTPNTNAFNALMRLMGTNAPQQVEFKGEQNITHSFDQASDEELDNIISTGGVLTR